MTTLLEDMYQCTDRLMELSFFMDGMDSANPKYNEAWQEYEETRNEFFSFGILSMSPAETKYWNDNLPS